MTPGLSRRDHRALRIGATLAIPMAFFLLVGRPGLDAFRAKRSALSQQVALLERERQVLHGAPQVSDLQARVSVQQDAVRAEAFVGPSALAAARMNGIVSTLAVEAGLSLDRVESRGSDAVGELRILRTTASASGEWREILTLLHSIESHEKLMRVSSFDILGRAAGGVLLRVEMEGLAVEALGAPDEAAR